MFTLRCTHKALKRARLLPSEVRGPVVPPTTALGDWYMNTLNFGHERLLLCMSAPSRLSVIVPARELKDFPDALARRLRGLLHDLGVAPHAITRELRQMEEMAWGVTLDRSVLGSMNDMAFMAEGYREVTEGEHNLSLRLAEVPCGPLNYGYPVDAARRLLAGNGLRIVP